MNLARVAEAMAVAAQEMDEGARWDRTGEVDPCQGPPTPKIKLEWGPPPPAFRSWNPPSLNVMLTGAQESSN